MKKKFTKLLGVGLTIALLVSLMVTAIPASALSQPSVSFGSPAPVGSDNQISKANANYIILVTLGKQLSSGDTITITFPSDTTIAASGSIAGTVSASPGWYDGSYQTGGAVINLPSGNWTSDSTLRSITKTLTTGDKIGESATVRLSITAGITNPTTAGSYVLTVKTGKETTAVDSAAYSIVVPTVGALPGIVSVYNPGNVLMTQKTGGTAIQDALDAAGSGYTIEIGPGTYSEAAITTKATKVTIKAVGATADTIIKGNVNLGHAEVTLDGVTLQGMATINGTGNKVTIKNCVIKKAGPPYSPVVGLVVYDNAVASGTGTVSNCTFDTTASTDADTLIDINQGGLTVSGCSVTMDGGDTAVDVAAKATIKDNPSITGAGATGVKISGGTGTVTVSGNTFDSLNTALEIGAGKAVVNKNTIQSSAKDAIKVTANANTIIKGNDIKDTASAIPSVYALNVAAAASGNVSMLFNNITGNAKNVKAGATGDTTTVVDATHNWWGDAAGPAADTVSGTKVDTSKPLGAPATSSADIAMNTSSLAAKATANVDVSIETKLGAASAASKIAVGNYSENPGMATPPGTTPLSGGCYDVYIAGAANTDDVATIKLYNANVNNDTKVYVMSPLTGKWEACSNQGVNTVSGYAYVKTGLTAVPAISDLSGTVLALVEEETIPDAPASLQPSAGTAGVSIMPMFTWAKVPGAIRYEIALSEDPTFAILEWSYNVDNPFYKAEEELRYSTTYYWRVRGVLAEPYQVGRAWVTPATDWATSIFTTAAEPVEEEPIVVQPPPPADINVDVAPPTVTVEPATGQAIPTSILWVIVAIGAVLIIALIVLIVRTRRVA
jgi:hypothetical protein